ncbi:hypothetical protein K469DRAFT_717578 [Zopfia rhizophila CBS 207.26]|uniref:Uncharacterized protein n=1 Tax=Zopfia rhizophila CBS 207.26 TaxID=1314779 RepID=A0A6A6DM97_9PEZI|nr:hypothetical protein K469DRAFT_717578 [Zopfia rhizophila CBS 207.26]
MPVLTSCLGVLISALAFMSCLSPLPSLALPICVPLASHRSCSRTFHQKQSTHH